MPRHASGPSGPPPASMAAASSSSRIPNLLAPAPTARPACVSGLTSGFRRRSTSSRGRPASPEPGPAGVSRQRRRLDLRLDGDPAERRAVGRGPYGGPQVGVGLADPLERDPLVRDAGPPGDRPLAARDDVGAEAARCVRGGQPRDDRGDVVRLERVRAQPRIGERRPEVRGGRVERGDRRDEAGRPEPARGGPERLGRDVLKRLARLGRLGAVAHASAEPDHLSPEVHEAEQRSRRCSGRARR